MVKLVQTDRTRSALQALVDARGDLRSRLPLELLTAIQDHLDHDADGDGDGADAQKDAVAARTGWVEHRLLVSISKWNRSTDSVLLLQLLLCCVCVCIAAPVPDARPFTWLLDRPRLVSQM